MPTASGRPGSQFGVVAERLAQSRREPALRVASAVAATLGRLPPRVLVPALRAQAESVDFAANVVPGLRKERHICGAAIEALYPLGPRLGCPINITAFGNGERLDIGLAIDEIAFPSRIASSRASPKRSPPTSPPVTPSRRADTSWPDAGGATPG